MKILLISASLLCLSMLGALASNIPPGATLKETEKAKTQEFTEVMHCPLCLSFVSALRGQMLRLQPGPGWSPREREAYLRREDRLTEILEETVTLTGRDYIWVNEAFNQSPTRGRYWHIERLKDSGAVSKESMEEVERQRAGGGDSFMRNYLRMTLLHENEEILEDLARKNVTDLTLLRQRVCVTGPTPICKGLNLQDMVPRDLEVFVAKNPLSDEGMKEL